MAYMKPLLKGVLAGTAATIPMSVVMQALHRWPRREMASLPPRQITYRITKRLGLVKKLDQSNLKGLTLLNHFAYGASIGGLYALITSRIKAHPILKGAAWGMIIWIISYLGWLPAAGILPPATQHTKQRNLLMIISHLVWGITTAILVDRSNSASSES
jgi:uncharacterized membrane protein YagU involved in acid resistance